MDTHLERNDLNKHQSPRSAFSPVTGVVTALQSPHFRKYKEQAQPMVKSLTLLDTDPIPHCSKLK